MSASPYSGIALRLYDAFVLNFTSPFAWGCRKKTISELYRQRVSVRHAEVGVGSGYFLKRLPRKQWESLALIDPNRSALSFVKRRLPATLSVEYNADILRCETLPSVRFQSVAANYVLHCLPGPMAEKDIAIENLASLLVDDGTLFGATVLGASEKHNALGRIVMGVCNRTGAFGNVDDTEEGLRRLLSQHFMTVDIRREGTVAIFVASQPRRSMRSLVDTRDAQ
ncbi:class I SAM-dependent methyltransferase [Rhodococcus sp. 14-2483-1-2]|uniref:class I SAM-dependent methyltransferase n=1 Tax=Rhodococcus sp. 14-2483-1-2 TaxID=2023147 RepID=UPI00113FD46C|nr:class I SAM-dependent methyltransferase [Rhodococcus sp. 14-2483-1-2]